MKASKITLMAALIAGVILAGSMALQAQNAGAGRKHRAGPRGPAMKQRFDKMAADLKLTDEQKTRVREAQKAHFEKIKALRADSSLTSEQKREKHKALREGMDKQMKAILTGEQFEKWKKMHGPHGSRGFGGKGRGPRQSGGKG